MRNLGRKPGVVSSSNKRDRALAHDTPVHSAGSIAEHVGGELAGPADITVTGVSDFDEARPGQLVLIGTQRYADRWAGCPADSALIKHGLDCDEQPGKALIRVDNADLAFSKAMELFAPPPVHTEPGIHPTAIIHETAKLGKDARIGPNCLIGRRA